MHNHVDLNDVKTLIATLRTVYASQFNKHFPVDGLTAIPMHAVEQIALGTLVGVHKAQFSRGLAMLSVSGKTFMPSFAEFRTLCIGHDWWNAQKAWVKACEYTKIMKHKPIEISPEVFQFQEITTIAKFALDQVSLLIRDGEMYHAKKQFIELYEEYLAEAQLKGKAQDWYQEPKKLTYGDQKKEHTPVSNDAAKQALENLQRKLNVRNRAVHKPQQLKATPKVEPVDTYWPDPFDNPEEYSSLVGRKVSGAA